MIYVMMLACMWFTTVFGEGFMEGTLVWTKYGVVPIEQLQVYDEVISYDIRDGSVHERSITNVHQHQSENTYCVVCETAELHVEGNQLFICRCNPFGVKHVI